MKHFVKNAYISYNTLILYSLLCLIVPVYSAQANELCGNSEMLDVLGGEYRIFNNVWGSCTGVGTDCIEAYPDSTYFKVISSTHAASCVAAYPCIYKGCHWNVCTQDSNMPVKVRNIISAPFTWDITTNDAGGTWNCAMDVWFGPSNGISPNNGCEMMIWINYHGGAGPAGSQVGTIWVGGTLWAVYYAQLSNWKYVAYKKLNVTTSVDFDLKTFINDAMSRGYISNQWYLDGIEAGYEIWSDGNGLQTNSFTAMVNVGPDNVPPTVSITSPSNGDTFTAGSDITIDVNAFDNDGSVTKVEFFQGATKLGELTSPPYSVTWSNVSAGYYSLTAKATDDDFDVNTSAAVNIHVIGGSGTILREWWTGIPGSSVTDLTSDVNYPDKPKGRELISSFEGPTNWADNYGSRFRGFLHPSADGDYTFWISSNANSQLLLSTDDNPANTVIIASVPGDTNSREWTKYPEQQSSPITLSAGGKYYIEALHKASDGNDNIAVAWGDDPDQQVIDGRYLSPCCLDFRDFSRFASKWRLTNCNAGNSWCSGADFNRDGSVLLNDLKLFTESWLDGM